MMDNMGKGMTCGCPHHKMVPLLVVLFGLAFLLEALGMLNMSFVNVAWPVLVILAGLMKMFKGMCKCDK